MEREDVAGRSAPRAVWICGSAASGKSEIGRAVLPLGFELIDTDSIFEELLQQSSRDSLDAALSAPQVVLRETLRRALRPKLKDWKDPRDSLEHAVRPAWNQLWAVAREITRRALSDIRNRKLNPLVVETGGQAGRTLNTKKLFESEGYQTFLVWVFVSSKDDVRRRNRARGLAGGRCLPSEVIERSFTVARKVRKELVEAFRPSVLEIDNSEDGEEPLGRKIREVNAVIRAWTGL